MISKTFLTTLLLAITFSMAHAQQNNVAENPGPGVPRDLAKWRTAHYTDVRYSLKLKVTPGADMLRGTEEIRVSLRDVNTPLLIDWRRNPLKQGQPQPSATDVTVNGLKGLDVRETNDHLIIQGKNTKKGENVIQLNFESPIATSGSGVTRYLDREDKSEYVYTLFVPSDASTAFPCFDQPDLKARFTLEMTAPEEWTVVTNTATERTLPGHQPGLKTQRFRETEPISTYLFAFAAGPFSVFEDKAKAEPHTRIFVRRSKTERAREEMPELFRLQRECLKYLAGYFDFKFPFPKYDLVLVPEFAYGGMEHAGATFLREDSVLFPTDPTANDFISRADLMFHEAAHQWFGDLVTMRWFDDLWLKEGFAEFMAFKTIESVMPQYNAWKVFYQRIKPAAYLTDVTKGTTPIFQEIPNLSAAKSAYGNIVYRKAPSMLRQAEFLVGPEKFRQALRVYLKEHAYSNAEWADLVHAFERTSGQKLETWAAAWVKRRGMPDVQVDWSSESNDRVNQFIIKEGDVLNEGGSWPMRIRVILGYKTAPPETLDVNLSGTGETVVKEAIGKKRPDFVFANFEDFGYGRFLLDDKSQQFVLGNLGEVKDDFLRSLLWGALWDSVREARLAPAAYIELAERLVTSETDEVTVQSLLGRMSTAYIRYLSDTQARDAAPGLENLLRQQMISAPSQGLRITYFRSFQAVATTDEARNTLKQILTGKISIPGMTLRSRDRFDIITALLSRNDSEGVPLLMGYGELATTDDERRYAFASAAAAGEASNKKKYFDQYLNDAQLPESWIEASIGPFNTIHQAELTETYLEPALKELPKLKRTRKIFFVNNWLSAFIGGQCSANSLETVQHYLDDETGLDRDLRLKVLENVDGLGRCVRIRQTFANKNAPAEPR
jgi:aminopeptidase N